MILPRFEVELHLHDFIKHGERNFGLQKKGNGNILFFNSGSECFTYYLSYLSQTKKLIVGVPLYACTSISHSVYSSGNIIKYLDIGINNEGYLFNMEDLKDIDVLIFIHYFGYQYKKIEEIKLEYPDLIIIEDCTHLSMNEYFSNSISNIAVFSFNFHKPVVAGSGGAILFNQEPNLDGLVSNYKDLKELNIEYEITKYCKVLLKSYAYYPPIYSLLKNIFEKKREKSEVNLLNLIKVFKIGTINKYLIFNKLQGSGNEYKNNYLKIPRNYRLNVDEEDVKKLSYFPLFCKDAEHRILLNKKIQNKSIDCFILWQNALRNTTHYGLNSFEKFKHSIRCYDEMLFLPVLLLKDRKRLEEILGLLI